MAPRPNIKKRAPGPTTVLLVRHGQTSTTGAILPGRAPGLHLAPQGVAQAETVAERLAALEPTAVYTSPLERTRETAAPISRACGLRTRSAGGLLECDFGSWTGKRLAVLRRKPEWAAIQHIPSAFRFPGGESFAEMQVRVWEQLGDLVSAHPGEKIVAVSHADPIKVALAMAAAISLDNFQRLVISPGSVTALLFTGGSPIVLCVNNTGDDLRGLAVS